MLPDCVGRIWLITLMVILLSACAGSGDPERALHADDTAQITPLPEIATSATPAAAAEHPAESRLLLNEVLFAPTEQSFAFVELKNAGGADAGLAGLMLENERGETIELPASAPILGLGEVYLISMDAGDEGMARGFAFDDPSFLSMENGTLFLYDPEGILLDRVDWGVDNPDSVRLSRGAVPPAVFPSGVSIGRHPLSATHDPLEWTTFTSVQVTPGEPNPTPGVEILIPFDGASFEQPEVPLAWYVVPGAVAYRVQVSSDAAFESPKIDAVVQAPPVTTDRIPPGYYFWRVQALNADGGNAEFSPIHTFTVEASESALSVIPISYRAGSADPLQEQRSKVLNVPQIYQKKDSNMLLLESPRTEGAHAWNVPHPGYSGDDPADNANCALASIAMLNHYFGGDLTQDFIGWDVFHNKKPGPEMDLNWGKGLKIWDIERGLAYALPGSLLYSIPENVHPDLKGSFDFSTPESEFFDRVAALIDEGRPVLAIEPGHATVITGYRILGDARSFHLNDPTVGKYWVDATRSDWRYYFEPGNNGQTDDPTHYLDFDGDGINNFDEMYRFSTNPNNPDTDGDGLSDGIDVYGSVHDEHFGYSGDMNMRGRDFDNDGVPMELDFDADDGGCMDSFEDLNLNGIYERPQDETWNFADWDDQCWKLTMVWIFADEYGNSVLEFQGNFRVGEEQEIEGMGRVDFSHFGPCLDAIDRFGFEIGGVLEGETLKLEITDIPAAQGPDLSDDLRCSAGKTIEEAWAVSFGGGWALPAVIELPAEESATVEIDTRSTLSTRTGDLSVTIEKKEIDYSS